MSNASIHCHVSNVSRKRADGTERSVVAKAAYNAGAALRCDRNDRVFSFNERVDVIYSALFVPNAVPAWCSDREQLWNTVEASARRRDSRLAKSIEAAFSREISADERKALIERFAAPFVQQGIVVDVAIHDDGTNHNPHVHFLLTTQEILPDGFGKKLAFIDSKKFLHDIRERWADESNAALRASGSGQVVDHRSFKKQSVDRVPTRHRGPNPVERSYRRKQAHLIKQDEGHTMPTQEETLRYPLLTQRDTWPPASPFPDQSMTDAERSELKTYFEDQRTQDQERSLSEDTDARTRVASDRSLHPDRSEQSSPWYEEALLNAKGQGTQEESISSPSTQATRDYTQEHAWSEERAQAQSEERDDLVRRAISMDRTREEHEIIKSAEHQPKHVRDGVQRVLFEERITHLQRSDERERLAAFERSMEPSLRDKLRSAVQSIRGDEHDREAELPVPGPDQRPISPQERDEAERMMIGENERDR